MQSRRSWLRRYAYPLVLSPSAVAISSQLQVDALATQQNNHARTPSFPTMHRASLADSTPSSPLMAGVDHIPCAPAPGSSPSSPLSTSPRPGGGVEALRLSRGSITSSPAPGSGRDIFAMTTGAGSIGAAGSSTPYGNLSLAAATHGAGAPGALTPPNGHAGLLASAMEDKEKEKKKGLYPSRVVLTSTSVPLCPLSMVLTCAAYPSQAGINPIPVNWGAGRKWIVPLPFLIPKHELTDMPVATARERGPVVCSRIKSNLPLRNSIGAHAGSYSIYRALSIAMGQLRPDWRPDLTNTHVSRSDHPELPCVSR
jgi:hypothetical protein